MRAVVCREYGPPESLIVDEVPVPSPRADQVVVDVAAAAVNFPDVLMINNQYQVSVPPPFTPGTEFSGIVTAVGSGVDAWEVGDRVFGSTMVGAFAEYAVADAGSVRRVPSGVDLESTAGFWVAHATAYHALRSVAEVKAGDKIVVLGAAGGVGLAAVEVAAVLGAEVIAAASSSEKLALCRQRGAAHTIDYEQFDLRDSIRELAPDGADVVIDPVGGGYAERALRAIRWGGRFVTVGFASGEIPRIPLNLVLLKGVVIKGLEVRTFAEHAPAQAGRDESELMELLAAGRISPYVSSTYSLDDVAVALRELADRRALGKVLVTP
jgi:NADPH:quinone reductase-like Zn-dependent oxidoreductase